MSRLRILHVLPGLGVGGAERLVVNLVDAADRQRFDVSVCSLQASRNLFGQSLAERGRRVIYLKKRLGPDPQTAWDLLGVFRAIRPHVVHTHTYALKYALPGALAARVPAMVHTVHNEVLKELACPDRLVARLAFAHLGVVPVGLSEILCAQVRDYYRLKHVPCIRNAIPTQEYRRTPAERAAARTALGLGADDVACIHVGRFDPQKNHDLLVRAFALAHGMNPNLVLLLVGDGELRPSIEQLTDKHGIRSKVRFLGVRGDIPHLLAASDMFVLSSAWEGLPLAIIEAMAAALPVVSTRVGGVADLVPDGVAGYLVENGDCEGLAKALVKLADDRETARRLGRAGASIVEERFDVSVAARAYESLYLRLLETGPRFGVRIFPLPRIQP